ncbi:hypothetical protein C8R45DRAFT_929031 [Mycena sanguinolenta]|nr:hypothetical protein C8R45DRAFT_929031 [Mycena sanguinolenta]
MHFRLYISARAPKAEDVLKEFAGAVCLIFYTCQCRYSANALSLLETKVKSSEVADRVSELAVAIARHVENHNDEENGSLFQISSLARLLQILHERLETLHEKVEAFLKFSKRKIFRGWLSPPVDRITCTWMTRKVLFIALNTRLPDSVTPYAARCNNNGRGLWNCECDVCDNLGEVHAEVYADRNRDSVYGLWYTVHGLWSTRRSMDRSSGAFDALTGSRYHEKTTGWYYWNYEVTADRNGP